MRRALALLLLAATALHGQLAVRVKDITRVAGVRDNQLVGYGLVVGLNGRGDSPKSKVTRDTAANLFQKFHVRVDPADIVSRNIAAVIVTATLPAFAEPGSRIDAKVAAVGDAQSLENGELLQTALLAADGRVYAVAQGTVVTVQRDSGDLLGRLTTGYLPAGALVERTTTTVFAADNTVRLVLDQPDWSTVRNIVTAVNARFGDGTASAKDHSAVALSVPPDYRDDLPRFLAEVGELEVEPGTVARVVIDRRSGTVVMGGDVKVGAVAVSQRKLTLEIGRPPACFLDELNDLPKRRDAHALEEATDVKTIVDGLNRMGARTDDIISILRALKAAGALHAQLIIL